MALERPSYQLLPPLSPEEYVALRDDIRERGVQVAVEYDEAGNVLDGHHRLQACRELGVEDYPRIVRCGMTEPQKRQHVRALNLSRRHLSREQRRGLIAEQLKDAPETSNRQIATALGVNHETVGSVRERLEATGEIRQLERTIGADGKSRPVERRESTPPEAFNEEAEVQKAVEMLLREVVPPALEAALTKPLPEPAPRLEATRPQVPRGYSLADEPPLAQCANLALLVERLGRHPLTGEDFKRQALPYTLARVRQCIPAVVGLLQEIEKD